MHGEHSLQSVHSQGQVQPHPVQTFCSFEMKIFVNNLILVFIFFFSNQNIAYGEKYLEVLKLYDLYSQEILDIRCK